VTISSLLVTFLCISFAEVCHGRVSKRQRTSRNTRRSVRRSRQRPLRNFARAHRVIHGNLLSCFEHTSDPHMSEEFGIYLNYVRKLGFEETPDYDFLRELFAKVMKNNNDVDDGVYDWNLLNGMFSLLCLRHSLIHRSRWSRMGGRCGMFFLLIPLIQVIYSTLTTSRAKIRYSLRSPSPQLHNLLNPNVEGISNSNIGNPTVAGHQR
jgi:hypothetical protein